MVVVTPGRDVTATKLGEAMKEMESALVTAIHHLDRFANERGL